MIGILVQLAISWLLLWFIEKKHLNVLGFRPIPIRIYWFFLFFLVTAACCAFGFLLRIWIAKEVWQINPEYNFKLLLEGLWWNIKSVLFEELIFRGAILYILMKRVGIRNAILITAAAFGIYHWFSQELFGNIQQMTIVFIFTGAMGLVLAYGFARTMTLYVPIAIHLGWNFTQQFIFSQGPTGNGLLILRDQPIVQVSYFQFFMAIFFPSISAMIVNFFLIRRLTKFKPVQ